jgi:lysophospholipase L1-like esterase
MKKIRIMCFGDSYTWGYVPGSNHERFPENIRFPKVLQKMLGSKYEIIEEGLNSRTLISDDKRPGKEGRNGSLYITPCLDTHDPLDLVVLMLGVNELKHTYKNSPEKIGNLLDKFFVKVILNRKSQFQDKYPKLLIISLPVINEKTKYCQERYIGGEEKSKKLISIYRNIAKNNKCYFINASKLAVGVDGLHPTKESHIKLAGMLYNKIKAIKFGYE